MFGNIILNASRFKKVAPKLYLIEFSPPCRAVLMVAKAIGLPIDVITVNLLQGEQLKPEFLKLNPQHTVPTLDDEGFAIWYSHAISIYLVTKYAKDDCLYPNDAQIRAVINQRLHFDSGIAFPLLLRIVRPLRLKQTKIVPDTLKAEVRDVYGLLETFLTENEWVSGDVSIADIQLVATISSLQLFEPVGDEYPNLKRWLNASTKQLWYKENTKGLETFNKMFSSLLNA